MHFESQMIGSGKDIDFFKKMTASLLMADLEDNSNIKCTEGTPRNFSVFFLIFSDCLCSTFFITLTPVVKSVPSKYFH